MKSKPVYAALEMDPSARRHLFLTQGPEGRDAARRLLASQKASQNASQAASQEAVLLTLDDPAALEAGLCTALEATGMDTAFYVAGPETFLWQTAALLRRAGVENRRIRQELAGSAARRVYCVHCGALNEQVRTSIHRCIACGLHLTVRDHFSRTLQAYMGVIVDAESPGDMPEPEMVYL